MESSTKELRRLFLLARYVIFVMGMASYMFAVMKVASLSTNDLIVLDVISFTLGIFAGDPNTLIFYQRQIASNGMVPNSGFWVARALVTTLISLIAILIAKEVTPMFLVFGVMLAYIFPQGRISDQGNFEIMVIVGGVLKIFCSGLIIYFIHFEKILPVLMCMAVGSNYLASTPLHLAKFYKKGRVKEKNPLKEDLKKLMHAFSMTIPIHLYTSLGGFIYAEVRGLEGLGLYYLYDRITRGLGATVLTIQATTTSKISKIIKDSSVRDLYLTVRKYLLYYSVAGLIVGLLFVITSEKIFNYMGMDVSFLDNKYILSLAIITSAMYISNLLGVQIFMVMGNIRQIFISSIIAVCAFIITLIFSKNQLLIVGVPEICIAIYQFLVFFLLKCNINIR